MIVGPISRGSVSLVFALVKGEGCSPAHEGIRGVQPCDSGQATFRAHPPIEPARDQGPHRQGVIDWLRVHESSEEASRLHHISALCLRLQRESSVRRWGVDGKGRGARGGGARVEGVDVASAPDDPPAWNRSRK
jgi:hypothetical protein